MLDFDPDACHCRPDLRRLACYRARLAPPLPTTRPCSACSRTGPPIAIGSGDAKVCYALVAAQLDSAGQGQARSDLFPHHRLAGRAPRREPEVVPGYQYKDGSTVTVQVGSDKFEFFTKNEDGAGGAWVEQPADEARLVEAMKRRRDHRHRHLQARHADARHLFAGGLCRRARQDPRGLRACEEHGHPAASACETLLGARSHL